MRLSVNCVCEPPTVTLNLFFPLSKPTRACNKPVVPLFIQKSLSLLDQLLSAFECFHGSQVIPCAKYMLGLVLAVAE